LRNKIGYHDYTSLKQDSHSETGKDAMTNIYLDARSTSSPKAIVVLLLVFAMPVMTVAQTQPSASAQVVVPAHIRGGSDLIFKMKLNEALPEGARFDVRLSPVTADQEITVSSGDPANRERTEFILKTRLPEKVVPGEWHIKIVYLFLAGASWTSNTLATNPDFRFVVEGPKVEIPTRATASLVDDKH
jgi:hypothetical protein